MSSPSDASSFQMLKFQSDRRFKYNGMHDNNNVIMAKLKGVCGNVSFYLLSILMEYKFHPSWPYLFMCHLCLPNLKDGLPRDISGMQQSLMSIFY